MAKYTTFNADWSLGKILRLLIDFLITLLSDYRVDTGITPCIPHRTGLTDFPYPALQQAY